MNITVWGINYAPETTGIGPCTTALCRFLAARGHEVRVVTSFPYYPMWEKLPGYKGRLFLDEVVDWVRVHRCWHYVPRRASTLRRIVHEASFVFTSFFRALRLRRPDLFIVVSPPLLLGAAAWLLSKIKRTPFLFHVQDLQPDAAAGLGLIKSQWFLQALLGLEQFSYARAAALSGISPGMLDLFRSKGVGEDKLLFFPNPVELPAQLPPRGRFRERHRLGPDLFLAVYSGNLGQKQGLETLVQAARLLAGTNVQMVVCGEGNQRRHLAEQIRQTECPNISLLQLQSATRYSEMLVDADVCLIPQMPGTGRCFFPSKLLSALAHGKSVLAIADDESELVRLLRQHQFGLEVPPGQPELLAQMLWRLSMDRGQLDTFAQAGLRFIQQFAPELVLPRIETQITELARNGALAPAPISMAGGDAHDPPGDSVSQSQ